MPDLQPTIDSAWESRSDLAPGSAPAAIHDAVAHVITELDAGRLRVAERVDGSWITHQWIKKAVLLSFRLADNTPMTFAAGPHGAAPLSAGRRTRRRRRSALRHRVCAWSRRQRCGVARSSRPTSC